MKDFTQQASLLFGSPDDIAALAAKENVRLLVISDSHGSSSVVRAILREFGGSCDALCFCGDGVQDVLAVFEEASRKTPRITEAHIPPVAALVRGNGDYGTGWFCPSDESTAEVTVPRELVLTAAGKRILITHGHIYDVYYSSHGLYEAAGREGTDFVLFGHTHIANVQGKGAVALLNPGSCSRPRGGQPHTFAILSVKKTESMASPCFSYEFYQITSAGSGISFQPYEPRTGEFNLLW